MKNQDPFVGHTIVGVRRMNHAEMEREGWTVDDIDGPVLVLVLDNGVLLYPSRDPEGNGPGALFGYIHGVGTVCVQPPEREVKR